MGVMGMEDGGMTRRAFKHADMDLPTGALPVAIPCALRQTTPNSSSDYYNITI